MIKSLVVGTLLVVGMAVPAFAQSAASLVGTYAYNGTDSDGGPYDAGGVVKVTAGQSGALEVTWDDGSYVGVGQVVGNVLAIASVVDNKNTIMLLTINTDGSLSGSWFRRTDPGAKGTEVWKKK